MDVSASQSSAKKRSLNNVSTLVSRERKMNLVADKNGKQKVVTKSVTKISSSKNEESREVAVSMKKQMIWNDTW